MISKHTDNLQYVVACLATHSRWVKKFINNVSDVHRYFKLTPHDAIHLEKFIVEQGKRVLSASLIMEEKRWREVLPALKYMSRIMHDDLRLWWAGYINSYAVTDAIPKTPLHEAIGFINYLLSKPVLNDVERLIAVYEKMRNRALLYDFQRDEVRIESHDIEIALDAVDEYSVKLNPSLSIESFNWHISKIISAMQKNDMVFCNKSLSKYESQNVFFYKNRITGLVCVSFVSKLVHFAISKVTRSCSLKELILSISNDGWLAQGKVHSLIKVMYKNDVISIHRIRR